MDRTAFLCEVATHLDGLNYGSSYEDTAQRLVAKHERARRYAAESLEPFPRTRFMLWSPRVPKGALTKRLEGSGLELIINEAYAKCVGELKRRARTSSKDIGNPFFRCQEEPKFPQLWESKIPQPVHASASSVRTRPAFNFSLSRYELPRMLSVTA